MNFLLDAPAKMIKRSVDKYDFVVGQLLSTTTKRRRAYLDYPFAIDNGAFVGFDADAFRALLARQNEARSQCLFVAAPDVVGSARRTLEAWEEWGPRLEGWPVALVAQDGIENLPIPWEHIAAIFIGGSTDWKMSAAAADVVRCGNIMGKHVHVGRVNTPKRFRHFRDLGADTCDGSGVARFDWMLEKIAAAQFDDHPLFDAAEKGDSPTGERCRGQSWRETAG